MCVPALIRARMRSRRLRGDIAAVLRCSAHTNVGSLWRRQSGLEAPASNQGQTRARSTPSPRQDPRGRQVVRPARRDLAGGEILRPDGETIATSPLCAKRLRRGRTGRNSQESGVRAMAACEGYARFIETKAWREDAMARSAKCWSNLESGRRPPGDGRGDSAPAGPAGCRGRRARQKAISNRNADSASAGLMGQQVAAKGVNRGRTDGTIARGAARCRSTTRARRPTAPC